jgi:uncharacterized protein (TIGR02594 family)
MLPPWLRTAYKEMELGIKEIPGPKHSPRILSYWDYVDGYSAREDEVPWCSAGMNYVFGVNGIEGSRRANARSWLDWGQVLDDPIQGCVVIFYRGDPKGWTGHVALFTSWMSKKTIRCIGGNQKDRWTDEPFALGRVLGWRWPKEVDLGNYIERTSYH